jgi:guanylate kinase
MAKGKIIVISAPSGCGKSTIINSILDAGQIELHFSVSATNRNPREGEQHGVNYYFLTTDEFHDAVEAGKFIEWEEVYPGRYYGTLRSEIDRMVDEGKNVILDIDVKGALNVKKLYGEQTCTIFIEPPSVAELRRRLEGRGTDTPERIATRVGRAEYEISFAPEFDYRVINDNLDEAVKETAAIISKFIS